MAGTTRAHVVALRDIAPGDELCISYIEESNDLDTRTFELRCAATQHDDVVVVQGIRGFGAVSRCNCDERSYRGD